MSSAAAIRLREAQTLTAFVETCVRDGVLAGRVLDYGCGDGRYRAIIERAGHEWHGYDRGAFPGNASGGDVGGEPDGEYDSVLCTQVLQYAPRPEEFVRALGRYLRPGGALAITFPSVWRETDDGDLWRFTQAGGRYLLTMAGLTPERVVPRNPFVIDGEPVLNGYAMVGRKEHEGWPEPALPADYWETAT
jgi:SAM-dependent methyltransferase